MIKDLGIALNEAKRMGIEMPGTELAHKLFNGMKEQGLEKKGMHGVLLILEQMCNVEI